LKSNEQSFREGDDEVLSRIIKRFIPPNDEAGTKWKQEDLDTKL